MRNLKGNKAVVPAQAGIYMLVVCAFVVLASCKQNTFNSEKELMAFLQDKDNGYQQNKTVNGVDYRLMYRPTDLLVQQELNGNEATKATISELRTKYSKYMYFNLSMGKNGQELLSAAPKNRNEFGAMVNQLAFGMQDKVHLYTQTKDTLELVDFVYPRMYGMSRATTIMFVYPKDKGTLNEETLNFTIEDLGLYTGEVKFKIDIAKLNNEPKLNF